MSAADVALYRQIFAAERAGEAARARTLLAKVDDPALQGYAEAARLLSSDHVQIAELIDWLKQYRELSVADRVYRLAVSHSSKKVRRHHKIITVAVVTNIPAPASVGRRTGGYEDVELPEPLPASAAARAITSQLLADIKAGAPDKALGRLQTLQAANTAPAEDIAILSYRIAASYLAEGMDAQAYQLASGVANTNPCPQLEWDAGFAAYRLGRWSDAAAHLEKLAQNGGVMGTIRAQAAFWAARAHMQSGDPAKVVGLLTAAAKEEPTFYGLIAERMLGMDTNTGFSDAVLNQNDYTALMAVAPAHRAVALWQVGEGEFIGPELNRAFVENSEQLDPAMAALARHRRHQCRTARQREKRRPGHAADRPVPGAAICARGRLSCRSVISAGLRPHRKPLPEWRHLAGGRARHHADHAGNRHFGRRRKGAADQLYDPGYSLSLGQRYIAGLLDRLNGNLLELGGAYNAGPLAVNRWLATKAGKDDPLLFVESIPVAETRSYVKRLMEYHWMYRRRFGQDAKSLDETARGAWPIYRPATPPEPKQPQTATPTPDTLTQVSDARVD